MRLAGWVLLGTGVVLLIAGLLLSWLELRVAGVSAIALALVAMLFTLGRPSLAVTMKVPERHVQVGQRATGDLVVRNVGGRRTMPGRIDLPIGDQTASIGLPSLSATGEFAPVSYTPLRAH